MPSSFPIIIALIVLFIEMAAICLVYSLVIRKEWKISRRLYLREEMMGYTTYFAFFSSISAFGLNALFTYFIVDKLLESLFSYITNFFLVILGLSAAEIFYDSHNGNKSN